ncbi:hypothetical protein PMG11_02774 [Penicillium brasilianum]|uniref:Cholesterol oxidase n=1 Tax=Penicillium brasilianum TaxID=104259 RepID=A0A0F7TNN3_PENBI|nr:hypothetical protein PMG11_02774 [Penicillium brasilianum]
MSISGRSSRISLLPKWLSFDDPTQLFQLFMGDGQHAFSAHGLGGCSLINAGVFLKADEATLSMSPWPSEIRNHPSDLDEYYTRAEAMLQPTPYPKNHPKLTKLDHLRRESQLLGKSKNFYRTPLTIFFHEGRNNVGVPMQANRGTGHESTGLNDGSKNSVAVTYLADAWNWGAEIFCGCEVQYVEKSADDMGYTVHFSWHGSGRSVFKDDFKEQLFWVKAKEFCFLGAGSLGTTSILLRSKKRGLSMSPLVGRNLSGNGDLLLFGYNGSAEINGIARKHSSQASDLPGPTVTGVIDNRISGTSKNPLSGFVIQDGCIPEPLNPVINLMLTVQTIKSQALSFLSSPRCGAMEVLATVKSFLLGPYASGGALQRTSTYLIMSHDSNEMTLTLKDGQPHLRAPKEGRSKHFKWMKGLLEELFILTGAKMGYSYFYGRNQEEITVHLLGGANMSSDGTGKGGVTNHLGGVFTGSGDQVYEGLVCCDASVIPTALGVNPLATISALSERSLGLITKRAGLAIDFESKNDILKAGSKPKVSRSHYNPRRSIRQTCKSISWQFTENLFGYFSDRLGDRDPSVSEILGRGSSCAMRVLATIEIWRQEKGLFGSQYQGICTGTVSCRALSKATLRIVNGTVDFFTSISERAETSAITYHLDLASVEGIHYHLEGRKIIDSNVALSVRKAWQATTTIDVNVTRHDDTKVGSGILHISLADFQKQMRTFRTTVPFKLSLLLALITFFVCFAYQVSLFFFRPFVSMRFPQISIKSNVKPKQSVSSSCKIKARDGVHTLLEIYEPLPWQEQKDSSNTLSSPPVLFLPGITGSWAKYSLFALPFLRSNLVDYFTERGHRCYALTPRWSCDPSVAQKSTVFDCRLDVAAAVQYIRDREPQKPYVIAHCQGSVALCMALLDGTIRRDQLLGITANSVFMNQVFGYWNWVKGRTTLIIQLYETLAGSCFPIASSASDSLLQRLLDQILRFYPVGHSRDVCTSTACHRTSFAFGLLWNHENLDANIHDNVHTFFASTYTKLMKHLVRMGTKGVCLDNSLCPLLSTQSLQRLRGLPILFISGTDNQVFDPESTLKDYELLRRQFGEKYYRRFLAEGYRHLDPIVGKSAAEDVYWRMLAHMRWCTENEGFSTK